MSVNLTRIKLPLFILVSMLTGIAAPEKGQPFYEEAVELNRQLTLDKAVRLEYEKGYEKDKFGRLLAYVFVINASEPSLREVRQQADDVAISSPDSSETLVNLELVKSGLAKVSIYEKRRPLIYQDHLLKSQEETKNKKSVIWNY